MVSVSHGLIDSLWYSVIGVRDAVDATAGQDGIDVVRVRWISRAELAKGVGGDGFS